VAVNWQQLFENHLRDLDHTTLLALDVAAKHGMPFDSVVFHAGSLATYHADDLEIPFRAHPHFLRFAPVPEPNHLLLYRPGRPLQLLRETTPNYWHAPAPELDGWIEQSLEVMAVEDPIATFSQLGNVGRCAFIGSDTETARALGISRDHCEPAPLLAALDWYRGVKTPYEVACLREAQRIAGLGHSAVREGIETAESEFALHVRYLAATGQLDPELPYPNIIAWDEASAVLHYQERRAQSPGRGRSFLIDAGARCHGYASDVTRTYCLEGEGEGAGSLEFRALLDGMEDLQRSIVEQVRPGLSFIALHRMAEERVAQLLYDVGVITVAPSDALERGLVFPFFPHGLGHHLGLQVHDVGGCQTEPGGTLRAPPDDCPHLRTTRDLESGQVITIEPGLYFIASLLEPLRVGAETELFNWNLLDVMIPWGGIRIEDDVLVTLDRGENLTRPFVPGHRASSVA
jgi:Xaa-Pro dipeptidase